MRNRALLMASMLLISTALIFPDTIDSQTTQMDFKVTEKQKSTPTKDIRQTPEEVEDDELIYKSVDRPPVFPGGEASLARWIKGHINYPHDAEANGVQGIVTVQFEVTATGSIGQVKILRGKSPELDKEAMRVIKSLPKFTPGKINGHAVNCWYKFPVEFRL